MNSSFLNKEELCGLKKGAVVELRFKMRNLKTGFGGTVNSDKCTVTYKIKRINKSSITFDFSESSTDIISNWHLLTPFCDNSEITFKRNQIVENNLQKAYTISSNTKIFFIKKKEKISKYKMINKG